MTFNLQVGMKARVEQKVTYELTVAKFGISDLQVYATPMMIGLMEKASMEVVDVHLPEGFVTVGTHLDVKHLAATPAGMNVYAISELVKIQGKKLSFKIEAFDDKEKIGEGTHDRFIINLEQFLKAADSKREW